MGGKMLFLAPVVLLALQMGVDALPYYDYNYYAQSLGRDSMRSISDITVTCVSDTCGVGAYCIPGRIRPVCACLPGLCGDPLSQCIRVECVDNSGCRSTQTCVNQHCVNVCDGKCGINANCDVRNHSPFCTCPAGYTGNPKILCEIVDPEAACHPSPCGPNTKCQVTNNVASCNCLPGYIGNAMKGCHHECENDGECGTQQSCRDFKCVSPCSDCGINANCDVRNHSPFCTCPAGYTGNPKILCEIVDPEAACHPSPCGPNTKCQVTNNVASCNCLPGYIGNAMKGCHHECEYDGECGTQQSCRDFKCVSPCSDCGINANCDVRNHSPVCTCPAGYTGNPKILCEIVDPEAACHPSPCGPNTKCQVTNNVASCTCLPGYIGNAMNGCHHQCEYNVECGAQQSCRDFKCVSPCSDCGINANCETVAAHRAICKCPRGYHGDPYRICSTECTYDSDCPSYKPACVNNACVDPCINHCGINADCNLRDLIPHCSCPRNMTGNPYSYCRPFKAPRTYYNYNYPPSLGRNLYVQGRSISVITGTCGPHTCGVGAYCIQDIRPVCACPPGHSGDPLSKCIRIECVDNSGCRSTQTCVNQHCVNVCDGKCGINANCDVRNHSPHCTCPAGYTGNPKILCEIVDPEAACHPSPCGPNTKCQVTNNVASCTCLPGYIGNAMNGCHHECEYDGECGTQQSCRDFKCVSPCSDCGINANCDVRNHSPFCACPAGYTGNPKILCEIVDLEAACHPSPCGSNTKCQVTNNVASCTCLPGYIGNAMKGCHHECEYDGECGAQQSCRDFKCVSPCSDCGINANCDVRNHSPFCACPAGYTGNPKILCEIVDLEAACHPSPCGSNTKCQVTNNVASCTCLPGYIGNAMKGCHHECEYDGECGAQQSCRDFKCVSPCSDCGINANCDVRNHSPFCACPAGYTGNPKILCEIVDPEAACHPSPCGPNTKCQVTNNVASCTCLPGYIGNAMNGCHHECEYDVECGAQQSCWDFKCVSPCSDCGINANCETVAAHRAICKCPRGYHGDPYRICSAECTCDSDCPSYKPACVNNACVDPCVNLCGINADCNLRGLTPECSCPRNMTGDPYTYCRVAPKPRTLWRTELPIVNVVDLCDPNPCGINAKCTPGRDRTGAKCPTCACLAGYIGNALDSCERAECELDAECPDHLACVGYKCLDPCLDAQCGPKDVCKGRRHIAVCICLSDAQFATSRAYNVIYGSRIKSHGNFTEQATSTEAKEEAVEVEAVTTEVVAGEIVPETSEEKE